jgi:gliding motility-associated-like protein
MKNLLPLVISICCASSTIGQVASNGIVRDYPFTGNANDVSTNALNGTVVGATLTTDRFGTANAAYSFDGSINSYITIPATGLNTNQYTYSLWASLASHPISQADRAYFALSIGSTAGDQFINYNNNATFTTPIINGWGGGGYNTNHPLGFIYQYDTAQLNQWYHLVVTRTPSVIKSYVNNTLVDSITLQAGDVAYYGSAALSATIGNRFDKAFPFHGKIDDLRLYNIALNASEINTLYTAKATEVVIAKPTTPSALAEAILTMPNVFTPNGDDKNDVFKPTQFVNVQPNNQTLSIYNKWGKRIALSYEINAGWNGKINATDATEGTYYWQANYTTLSGETKTENGFFTLLK